MKKPTTKIAVIDVKTGEKFDLEKYFETKTPAEISENLSKISLQKNQLKTMEEAIKKYVQRNVELEFKTDPESELEYAGYGMHRIRKSIRFSFDTKKLDKKGTEEDKELYAYLKRKYLKGTEYLTWD